MPVNLEGARSKPARAGLTLEKHTLKMMLVFSDWQDYNMCLALASSTSLQSSAKGIPKHPGTVLLCSERQLKLWCLLFLFK